MTRKHSLGALQLAIMQVVWEQGQVSVNDVHAALLPSRGLAPTTIATMLKKMEEKGVVAHTTEGRKFIYHAAVSEANVRRSMVADMTNNLFGGKVTDLVSHLLAEHEVDADELTRLRGLIERHDADREADR